MGSPFRHEADHPGLRAPAGGRGAASPGRVSYPKGARADLDPVPTRRVRRLAPGDDAAREPVHTRVDAISGLELDRVLRPLVRAARLLVCARYASLTAPGLAAPLIEDGVAGHASGCFLGVPIIVREAVFGDLCLIGKQDADRFSSEDEELVISLASAAAVAVDNAILQAEVQRRHDWQKAMVDLTTSVVSGTPVEALLGELCRQARAASRAEGASVALVTEDEQEVRVAAAEGTMTCWARQTRPLTGSGYASALTERRVVAITIPGDVEPLGGSGDPGPSTGPGLLAPIAGEGHVFGALVLGRAPDHNPFDPLDEELAGVFAGHAGMVLELVEARTYDEQRHLAEDRLRIAEDLRAGAIDRMFGLGLSLQAMAARAGSEKISAELHSRVDELDEIIHEVRAAVFSISAPPGGPRHAVPRSTGALRSARVLGEDLLQPRDES